jgi:hypothetical protein
VGRSEQANILGRGGAVGRSEQANILGWGGAVGRSKQANILGRGGAKGRSEQANILVLKFCEGIHSTTTTKQLSASQALCSERPYLVPISLHGHVLGRIFSGLQLET